MADLLRSWMPHAACFAWSLWLLLPFVVGGAATAGAYGAISWLLHRTAQAIKIETGARRVLYLFAAFVASCGIGHALDVWVLWSGAYGVQALWGLVTASLSVVTARKLYVLVRAVLKHSYTFAVGASVNEPLPRGADGDPSALQQVLSDLNVEVNDLFETLGMAMSITSPTGEVLYASPLMSQIFGQNIGPDVPASEWIDRYKPFRPDRVTPISLDELPTSLALRNGGRYAHSQSNLRPDGAWADIYLSAARIDDHDGNAVGVVNTIVPMVNALTDGQSALLAALEGLASRHE